MLINIGTHWNTDRIHIRWPPSTYNFLILVHRLLPARKPNTIEARVLERDAWILIVPLDDPVSTGVEFPLYNVANLGVRSVRFYLVFFLLAVVRC